MLSKPNLFRVAAAVWLLGLSVASAHGDARQGRNAQPASSVTVNGERLAQREIDALVARYGSVQPGDYWYDPMSGLYGMTGGPALGQLHASLDVGGPLAADASGGGTGRLTGVFINGREIHPLEYRFYQQLFGQVRPGRYWMNARGIGGYEGGPPLFNVVQAMSRRGGGDSVYMPWLGGKPGTHVGRASDGCVYISQGDYSAESC